MTLPPALRKFVLTIHIATSVGLLGAVQAGRMPKMEISLRLESTRIAT